MDIEARVECDRCLTLVAIEDTEEVAETIYHPEDGDPVDVDVQVLCPACAERVRGT